VIGDGDEVAEFLKGHAGKIDYIYERYKYY
jgi:hypothetical protein